jgi:hypothetical protein
MMVRVQVLVVRVYQLRRSGAIAGILESVDSGEQHTFRGYRELRQAMLACLTITSPRAKTITPGGDRCLPFLSRTRL